VIGIVLGLTGAGGALIAIPLFMQFLGMNLKEASVYSLVAVVVASLLNFISQRKNAQYQTASLIVSASFAGSYLTAPWKMMLPDSFVAITLAAVSIYALYSIWIPVKKSVDGYSPPRVSWLHAIIVGLILGVLTTITGLGGGVLMLPVFLRVFNYSHPQAISTGLLAVGLSSLSSLFIQFMNGTNFEVNLDLALLSVGILLSVVMLSLLLKRLPPSVVSHARQIVFTFVVVLALLQLSWKLG